jgi:hypothetical protein
MTLPNNAAVVAAHSLSGNEKYGSTRRAIALSQTNSPCLDYAATIIIVQSLL